MMGGVYNPEAALLKAGAREERFTPSTPARGKPYGRLYLLGLDDAAHAPPRNYLLRGLIAPGELSLWWGAPKCGKSFLLLLIAYRLALGMPVWGKKARPCRVLYVAAEGEGGFAGRLLVLRDLLGDASDAFRYIAQRATIGPPSDDLEDVISAARDMRADLIVLDTLARTFGDGDENAARDMSGFVASVDRLRSESGSHVAVIHHGTKEGGSLRGSSALLGAADLSVKVTKGEPSIAKVEAAKDDADGEILPFRLRSVELASNEDGEPRYTCIAEEAEDTGPPPPSLAPNARKALLFLCDIINTESTPLPVGVLFPTGLKGVSKERWRLECESRDLSHAGDRKSRDRVFRAAVSTLVNAGEIATRDGWVWLVKAEGVRAWN
ncbi:AAA family ATPase [Roseomonas harenae]|uniref:AAA family ATPase n=1 Tax=Muricoccus harenae TaxID=2692566 RepID=UPI0013314255|nr:AAA family ATPase [Roseomonas harenae]